MGLSAFLTNYSCDVKARDYTFEKDFLPIAEVFLLGNCNQMPSLGTIGFEVLVPKLKLRVTLENNHHLGACANLFFFYQCEITFQNPV